MYKQEGVSSVLLLKSLNKNRDSHFLIRNAVFVSKGNLFDIYFTTLQLCVGAV